MTREHMIVNGSELTRLESALLSLGDVVDADDLRDVRALRCRMMEVGILGKHRLQKQIDAVEAAAGETARALTRFSRP